MAGTAVVYRVGTDLVYAAIQEFGGTVTAKNSPLLHFEIDGEHRVARQVTIPPHPYMRPAFDSAGPEAARTIGLVFGQLLKAAV